MIKQRFLIDNCTEGEESIRVPLKEIFVSCSQRQEIIGKLQRSKIELDYVIKQQSLFNNEIVTKAKEILRQAISIKKEEKRRTIQEQINFEQMAKIGSISVTQRLLLFSVSLQLMKQLVPLFTFECDSLSNYLNLQHLFSSFFKTMGLQIQVYKENNLRYILQLFAHLVHQCKSKFDRNLTEITEFLQKIMNHYSKPLSDNKMKQTMACSSHKPVQTIKVVPSQKRCKSSTSGSYYKQKSRIQSAANYKKKLQQQQWDLLDLDEEFMEKEFQNKYHRDQMPQFLGMLIQRNQLVKKSITQYREKVKEYNMRLNTSSSNKNSSPYQSYKQRLVTKASEQFNPPPNWQQYSLDSDLDFFQVKHLRPPRYNRIQGNISLYNRSLSKEQSLSINRPEVRTIYKSKQISTEYNSMIDCFQMTSNQTTPIDNLKVKKQVQQKPINYNILGSRKYSISANISPSKRQLKSCMILK